MEDISKSKAILYLIVVPLTIGIVIFVLLASWLGLIRTPFSQPLASQTEIEALEELVLKHEETIDSLRQIIANQKNEILKIQSEYTAKTDALVSKEQSLLAFENQLKEREKGIIEEEERLEALARKFTQMRAREAANILSHMEDEEIIRIFKHMASQKVSEILSSFNSERAAAIALKMM